MSDPSVPARPDMRRLCKQEAETYRSLLHSWRSLSDVDAIMDRIDERARFYAVSQGGLKFWREAYVGMSCAYRSHALRFRLGGDPPDFELDYGDHVRAFELVGAIPAWRKPGLLYDKLAAEWNATRKIPILPMSHEEETAEHEAIPEDVRVQIQAKLGKNYSRTTILVVALHHWVVGDLWPHIEMAVVQHARAALGHFREIWIWKGGNVLRVSPDRLSWMTMPRGDYA